MDGEGLEGGGLTGAIAEVDGLFDCFYYGHFEEVLRFVLDR